MLSVPASAPTEETAETEASSSSSDFTHRSPARQPICPAKKAKPSKMWKNFFDEEDAEDEEPPVTEE